MKIYKLYINLDKEENWLNEMAAQGWALCGKCTKYIFQKAAPDRGVIKIDYRNFKTREDFQNYIALFQDSGWEHIAGNKSSGKQYFKKVDETAEDDIFSDSASKAERYKKMSSMWFSLALTYIPIFTALVMTKAVDVTAILNPKLLYYTPGLWEKTGSSFWQAFLFETPFAFWRGFFWLVFPCLIILYVIFAIKAKIYYEKKNLEKRV